MISQQYKAGAVSMALAVALTTAVVMQQAVTTTDMADWQLEKLT